MAICNWKPRYYAMLRQAADDAIRSYTWSICNPVYLYVRRAMGPQWGELQIADNSPGDAWELAATEHVPRSLTQDQLVDWMHRLNLPVLGD